MYLGTTRIRIFRTRDVIEKSTVLFFKLWKCSVLPNSVIYREYIRFEAKFHVGCVLRNAPFFTTETGMAGLYSKKMAIMLQLGDIFRENEEVTLFLVLEQNFKAFFKFVIHFLSLGFLFLLFFYLFLIKFYFISIRANFRFLVVYFTKFFC